MSVATTSEPAGMLGELQLHRLLVAIDGSANAELALSAAITAARRDNASVTLLTVGPDLSASPAAWSVPVTGALDQQAVDDDGCKRLNATSRGSPPTSRSTSSTAAARPGRRSSRRPRRAPTTRSCSAPAASAASAR